MILSAKDRPNPRDNFTDYSHILPREVIKFTFFHLFLVQLVAYKVSFLQMCYKATAPFHWVFGYTTYNGKK